MGQPDGGITAAVSIVIPLYNQLEYTRGCLDSLRRTSAADVELILVDNALKRRDCRLSANRADLY